MRVRLVAQMLLDVNGERQFSRVSAARSARGATSLRISPVVKTPVKGTRHDQLGQ